MRSGRFVQLKNKSNPKRLSKLFKVPQWAIESHNSDKTFRKGEWVFIPNKSGIGINGYDRNSHVSVAFIAAGDYLWPVPSTKRISSKFGMRWGRKHEGIDIPGKRGSHILAAQSGVVVYSSSDMGGYGNTTIISHKNGVFTVYAHALKNFTRKGQKVHRGQVIAQVGSTGRSTAPHLHFEMRKNSIALNPYNVLKRR